MQVAQQPAVVHVAHDMLDGIERHRGLGRVVHRQHDPGHDLRRQDEGQDAAERPQVVQVPRRWIGHRGAMGETDDRQPILKPAQHPIARPIGRRLIGAAAVGALEIVRPSLQPRLHPRGVKGLVGRRSAHDVSRKARGRQPIWILLSDRKAYGGTGRLAGAGPRRIRPEVSYWEPWQGQNQPP